MLFRNAALVSLLLASVACTNNEEKKVEEVVTSAKAEDSSEFSVDDKGRVDFKAEVVYFEFDTSTLTSEGMAQLDALAKYMAKNPSSKLAIEGHADNRGSVEYNLVLGQKRSEAVKQYLAKVGVEDARLSTVSFGEEKPQMAEDNEAGWAKNRRAEFTFSNG